jgi:hypothetical protein
MQAFEGLGLSGGDSKAGAHSNPLYDDASVRLTPRGVPPADASVATSAQKALIAHNGSDGVPVRSSSAALVSVNVCKGKRGVYEAHQPPMAVNQSKRAPDLARQQRGAEPPPRGAAAEATAAAEQLPGGFHAAAAERLQGLAPGGLSVLYENQAMRMEREELKSELKLISARVRVGS